MERLKKPVFVINFKSYPSSYGQQSLLIAKAAEKVSSELGVYIAIAPPYTEIYRLSREVKIDVFSQHVDPIGEGAGTGYVTTEMIKAAGAKGSIINHSEHRLKLSEIEATVKRLRELNMVSLVCADTPLSSLAVASFSPDIVAMEPPELIGTGISVSKAKPELITQTIELVRSSSYAKPMILVGAGIVERLDAKKAVELGADGILVSSVVMKSKEPEKIIRELALGLLQR